MGSRGVANIAIAVGAVGIWCGWGLNSFVVPAMGSHGASTAAGQAAWPPAWASTKRVWGLRLSLRWNTVSIGSSPSGVPVLLDRGRCRGGRTGGNQPHQAAHGLRGPGGERVCKMLAVGLGNQKGAATLHGRGMAVFPELIPEVGSAMRTRNLVFGIGISREPAPPDVSGGHTPSRPTG